MKYINGFIFADAFQWLCRSRKKHPPSSDIWKFRRIWDKEGNELRKDFADGSYRFDVQKKITLSCGETIALWSSCDALVIKVLTSIIQDKLKPFLSKTFYHLKGPGGLKRAVRDVMKLYDYIPDIKIIDCVWQFLNRCVEWGGLYQDIKRGIPRGASLSPLLGAFYLVDLDRKMEKLDVKYFRYMDDILILAPTRWKIKKAIRMLNRTFNELDLEQHPNKTLIGRTERGFDFLGSYFKPGFISVSKQAIKRFIERLARLYEQGADSVRIGQYVSKWLQLVGARVLLGFALNNN